MNPKITADKIEQPFLVKQKDKNSTAMAGSLLWVAGLFMNLVVIMNPP
jgi:hypothetical protein